MGSDQSQTHAKVAWLELSSDLGEVWTTCGHNLDYLSVSIAEYILMGYIRSLSDQAGHIEMSTLDTHMWTQLSSNLAHLITKVA